MTVHVYCIPPNREIKPYNQDRHGEVNTGGQYSPSRCFVND